MSKLSNKEILLAGRLLKLAEEVFANHGCNDIPDEIWEGWTESERKELIRQYYIENGEKEEADEWHAYIDDFVLMSFIADRIEDNYE